MEKIPTTPDIGLICSLVKEKDSNGLDFALSRKEWFGELALKALTYVSDFRDKYDGAIPALSTLGSETGIDIYWESLEPSKFYLETIRKRILNRAIVEATNPVWQGIKVDDPDAARVALIQAVAALESIPGGFNTNSAGRTNWASKEAAAKRWERYLQSASLEGGVSGIRSPWPLLDSRTLGYRGGDFVVMVGRKKAGKTWSSLLHAKAAWEQKKSFLFVSMEMPLQDLESRMDAINFRLPAMGLRAGQLDYFDKDRYELGLKAFSDSDPKAVFVGAKHIRSMSDVAREIIDLRPDIVLIDGIYIIGHNDSKLQMWERVTRNTTEAQEMAVRFNVPIFANTQFKRGAGNRLDADDEMIAYSDSLGQFATVTMALQSLGDSDSARRIIRVMTARNFQPINIIINWDLEKMDFSEIETKTDAELEEMQTALERLDNQDAETPPDRSGRPQGRPAASDQQQIPF